MSMSDMSGMPPPPPFFFSGFSAIMASVVSSSDADAGGVLQRRADDLGRVDDAGLDQVLVLLGLGVEAEGALAGLTLSTTIEPSMPAFSAIKRSGSSMARRTMLTPAFWSSSVEARPRGRRAPSGAQQRDAAAGHDALFDGRARRVQRILDARLLLLHLGLGGRADLDDGDAADQLRESLLELLAVVVGGGLLDLACGSRLHAALDVLLARRRR